MIQKLLSLKFLENIFALGLFLILLPPLGLFQILPDSLNSTLLGRLLILAVFTLLIYSEYFNSKGKKITRNYIIEIVVVFFIFQSLSVISVVNIPEFIKAYEKLIFGIISFFSAIIFVNRDKKGILAKTMIAFIAAGAVRLFMEIILLLKPDLFISLAEVVIKPVVVTSIKANLFRIRTYIDLLNEATLPFFFYLYYKKKDEKPLNILVLILILCLGLVAFLSNWRGRVIVFASLLVGSALLLSTIWQEKKKILISGLVVLVVSLTIVDRLQLFSYGFSVVDRLLNKDEKEDVSTIEWRYKLFGTSADMGKTYPFGVGLKNFYDFIGAEAKGKGKFVYKEAEILTKEAAVDGPHNIFFQFLAETGLGGFVVFLVMLGAFVVSDVGMIRKKGNFNLESRVIILAFWGLIIGTQFYPATALSFYVPFFFFRGLLVQKP